MQLFALDGNNQIIQASQALKNRRYTCRECGGILLRRGGAHRRYHFYHAGKPLHCRQEGKSLTHLQVQNYLWSLLPGSRLEVRFEQIDRIADVVWNNLVFEVQCSPISAEELLSRNADYARAGYEVVWILHDRRYNKLRLSAAELALQGLPHYFTNISADGGGVIYDQRACVLGGYRRRRMPRLAVDLSVPLFCGNTLCFSGDYTDRGIVVKAGWRERISEVFYYFQRLIKGPCQLVLQLLLEKSCR